MWIATPNGHRITTELRQYSERTSTAPLADFHRTTSKLLITFDRAFVPRAPPTEYVHVRKFITCAELHRATVRGVMAYSEYTKQRILFYWFKILKPTHIVLQLKEEAQSRVAACFSRFSKNIPKSFLMYYTCILALPCIVSTHNH